MKTIVLVLWGTGLVCTVTGQAPKVMKVSATGSSFMGVMVQEIDSERAKVLKLGEEAGVKVGDAIVEYNGQRVEGMEQFSRLVHETPAGREVKLDIVRNGAPQAV